VVCPTRFKTQEFCQMLREICPEINTAASGRIQSSRSDRKNNTYSSKKSKEKVTLRFNTIGVRIKPIQMIG
jgi:hypothetical protein